MKKFALLFTVFLIAFIASPAMAADKVVVVPLNSGRTPTAALPIAYGHANVTVGTPAFYTSYGAESITKIGTGDYKIVLENSFASYPAIIASSYNSSPKVEIVTTFSYSDTDTIYFNIVNAAGTPIDSNFSFVVFGDLL